MPENENLPALRDQTTGLPAISAMPIAVLKARVRAIEECYRELMKEGVHYGKIPGCDKPALFKPGAEKLAVMFQLALTPQVEDLSGPDEIRYRVTTKVIDAQTGIYMGESSGEASSNEDKYKWRAAVTEEEWDLTPEDRRRVKFAKGQRGPYTVKQVRTEPANQANTVLKMAIKRSNVGVTLQVTGASDIFDQDLEDLEHPPGGDNAGGQAAPAEPQRASAQAAPGQAQAPAQAAQGGGQAPRPTGQPTGGASAQGRPAGGAGQPPPGGGQARTGERVISEGQLRKMLAVMHEAGWREADLDSYLKEVWNVGSKKDVLMRDLDDILQAMRENNADGSSKT